jgi:hypothetical protein
MAPRVAALALESALAGGAAPITIADAATKGGLALRDAERGLHWLTHEYRGHLRVTSDGELLFLFPTGFTKPWETRDAFDRALASTGRVLASAARLAVRAWLTIVLVAYAAIFLAILLGMTFARSGNDNRRGRGGLVGGEMVYVLLRVLGDALFWTFHPFSPIAVGYGYDRRAFAAAPARRRGSPDETPFYEKVNRFFFGPTPPPLDPLAQERRLLALIRAQKGRIGLGDVMRVTGLPREEADPLLARLMLDYDGDVSVSEAGGITYSFTALRKTATDVADPSPPSAWSQAKELLPFTGNDFGANAAIFALNGFNLVMSLVALDEGLTFERLRLLFRSRIPFEALPDTGTAIALGVVPLVMSIALFALPVARAAMRPIRARKLVRENARLAVLRTVVSRVEAKQPVTDAALVEAWSNAAGKAPESIELTKEVVRLGGDAEIQESGEVRYRFPELEAEEAALEDERAAAGDEEKRIGEVVFASDE